MAGEGKLDKPASKLSFWGSCEKSCESRTRKDVRVRARSGWLAREFFAARSAHHSKLRAN